MLDARAVHLTLGGGRLALVRLHGGGDGADGVHGGARHVARVERKQKAAVGAPRSGEALWQRGGRGGQGRPRQATLPRAHHLHIHTPYPRVQHRWRVFSPFSQVDRVVDCSDAVGETKELKKRYGAEKEGEDISLWRFS